MNRQLQIAGLLLFILGSTSAQAFDNKRHAFIAGLSIGYHATDLDETYADNSTETSAVSGLATSIRVGFGLGNQFTLYYFSDGDWYNHGGDSWLSGINGIGSAYYFSSGARSPYVHYGYGYSYSSLPWESGNKGKRGNGYTLGLGYEFVPHVSLEANYLRTNLKNAIDSPHPTRTSSWRLMLQYLFY